MVKRSKFSSLNAALLGCAVLLTPLVAASDEDWQPNDYVITLSPYMWGSSIGGSSTVANTTTDIDVGVDTVLDNLRLGGMLDLRVDKGRWALQFDALYAGLSATDDSVRQVRRGPFGVGRRKVDLDLDTWILELIGHYRFTERFSAYAGARYYDMAVDVKVSPLLGPILKLDGKADWLDPIVGLQYSVPLSERWSFGIRGDIGGFGVGSDFAWQAWALAEYSINERTSLALGYRHLDWDYETGSGLRSLELDMHMTGPVVGMRFRF